MGLFLEKPDGLQRKELGLFGRGAPVSALMAGVFTTDDTDGHARPHRCAKRCGQG